MGALWLRDTIDRKRYDCTGSFKNFGSLSKIINSTGPGRIRLNAGAVGPAWEHHDSQGEPLKTLGEMKVTTSASTHSALAGEGGGYD